MCGSPFIVFKNSISFVLNLLKLGQHQNFWSNIVESICRKANLFFNWLFGKDEFLPRMYSWFYLSQFSCPAIILVPDLFSWSSRNSFKLCPTGLLLNRTNLVWGGSRKINSLIKLTLFLSFINVVFPSLIENKLLNQINYQFSEYCKTNNRNNWLYKNCITPQRKLSYVRFKKK